MSEVRKRNVYRGLIIWMLVLLALTAAAFAAYLYTRSYLNTRSERHLQEIEATNAERIEQHNEAVAELNQQSSQQADAAWPEAAASGWDVVDLSAYGVKGGSQQWVTRQEMLQGGLLLVNRWHAMPADLTDDMMVSINRQSRADTEKENDLPTVNASNLLQPVAVQALMSLYKAARDEGLDMDNIVIDDAYRTMSEQTELWNAEVAKYSDHYSGSALEERARRNTAYPGTSDYQTGLSFSVYNYKSGDTAFSNTPLHQTEQGRWLYQNGWRYGFVFRFPVQGFPYEDTVDKSYKTGISLNMKVYRYVGVANAAAMHTLGFCLEEYIEYLMQHPHIAVYNDGALQYEIYRMEGDAVDTMVTIPSGAVSYTASTDNLGGLVIAIAY